MHRNDQISEDKPTKKRPGAVDYPREEITRDMIGTLVHPDESIALCSPVCDENLPALSNTISTIAISERINRSGRRNVGPGWRMMKLIQVTVMYFCCQSHLSNS